MAQEEQTESSFPPKKGKMPAETATKVGKRHYVFLIFTFGIGLLPSILGRIVSFHTPFAISLLVTLLAFLGIDQMWCLVKG
jgi:ABC-type Mn2+/Zn2+ transport system permease subunit